MERRRLGKTEHRSTVAIFGSAALFEISQPDADQVMERVIAAGVNHVDVAPSYGMAEERLGPWMAQERERFFLGCKTLERGKEAALAEMHQSLGRLRAQAFDLYQLHAVTSLNELDKATQQSGALEGVIEARTQGLTRFIGITSHGNQAPSVLLEALERFDFDTVLFPLNFVQFAIPEYRANAQELLRRCRERDVGVMVIKAIAQEPWGECHRKYTTWYRPFEAQTEIQQAVSFALSHDVTGLCTVADPTLLPHFLTACERFQSMPVAEQDVLVERGKGYDTIFEGMDD